MVFLSPLNRLEAGLPGHALSWSSVCFVTRSLESQHDWRPAFLVSRFRVARLCDPSVSRSCVCLATAFLFTRPARFSMNGHLYAGHAFSWPLAGFAPSPRMFVHSLACLLALALAGSLACLSLACFVACFLGQASISLPMVCAGLRSFGAGLSAPLLKCALAPQREPCRMRALICPRSGRSHKLCAPSGSRSGAARVCPEIKNSSNTNQSKTTRCESARKWS